MSQLPGFLCIGAQKAGTSWLFEQLRTHPDVWMPPLKELHFFNHLFVPENRKWTDWHIRTNVRSMVQGHAKTAEGGPDLAYLRYLLDLALEAPFTEAWYRRAFDRPAARNRLTGDITPEYSTLPPEGIDYVRGLLGAVKIIYLIRDPVDRALSQIRMNAQRRGQTPAGLDAWRALAGEWDVGNRGDYATFVPRWRRAFAPADLLFLPYKRIARDPRGVMTEVERFLGLPPGAYPGLDRRVHATRPMRTPPDVTAMLRGHFAAQEAFLRGAFEPEFLADVLD